MIDLQPYSTNYDLSQEMEERASNYDMAVEKRIVREYQIVIWPSIEKLIQGAEAAIAQKDMAKIKQVVSAIESYKNIRESEKIIPVPNDGASGHEAKVRKDQVIASKGMSDIIKAELDKEARLEEVKKKTYTEDGFFNAVYTGVLIVNFPPNFLQRRKIRHSPRNYFK